MTKKQLFDRVCKKVDELGSIYPPGHGLHGTCFDKLTVTEPRGLNYVRVCNLLSGDAINIGLTSTNPERVVETFWRECKEFEYDKNNR